MKTTQNKELRIVINNNSKEFILSSPLYIDTKLTVLYKLGDVVGVFLSEGTNIDEYTDILYSYLSITNFSKLEIQYVGNKTLYFSVPTNHIFSSLDLKKYIKSNIFDNLLLNRRLFKITEKISVINYIEDILLDSNSELVQSIIFPTTFSMLEWKNYEEKMLKHIDSVEKIRFINSVICFSQSLLYSEIISYSKNHINDVLEFPIIFNEVWSKVSSEFDLDKYSDLNEILQKYWLLSSFFISDN